MPQKKSRAAQCRTKLKKKEGCKKCTRSFNNFRALFYHTVVTHSNVVERNIEPTLETCLSEIEQEYQRFLEDPHGF